MNCLLDQGLPRVLAAQLRQVGWDAVHVGEIRWSQAEDFQILERAAAEDRVVLTLDSDFHQLLALSGNSQPSVVRFRDEGLTVDQYVRLLFQIESLIQPKKDFGSVASIGGESGSVNCLSQVNITDD